MDERESGFTIVELMAVIAIGAVLLTLGAGALRDYTRLKALTGGHETTMTQLRHSQHRTFSEGYPKAYGIRFLEDGNRLDLVRYDASTNTCVVVESHKLTHGVTVSAAATDFLDNGATGKCEEAAPNASTGYEVALFYARGTANGGTVTYVLEGTSKQRTLDVNAATGKVSP